jgi:hypothetical protein
MNVSNKMVTANLATVLEKKSIPGVTSWNRLEGRPRTERFDRALRAEVRDALWMLTRQWQMGELEGDDAGSPIQAKVRVETTRLRKYQSVHGAPEPFDDGTPLETRVEGTPVAFTLGGAGSALDIRLLMGRYWLKLVSSLEPASRSQYIGRYRVHAPDPAKVEDAPIVAHRLSWSAFAAASAAGGAMDGKRFYDHLTKDGGQAADGITSLVGREAQAAALAERFVAWFDRLITQPAEPAAWEPDRLEYRFSCSAPNAGEGAGEKVFVADEYFQGHLDWYNLDVDRGEPALQDPAGGAVPGEARSSKTLSMLPTQVGFNGMPNTRWWEFEDNRTNFGDIRPDTTDLAKLLLIEFGLVYANDWFLVPFTVPAGSIAQVRGIAVTNVFGERTWVEAAGRGVDDDWRRWAMFLPSVKGNGGEPADTSLLVLPAAQGVLEGRPLEEVLFARDEMANMVWGIERTIPLPSGDATPGARAASETYTFYLRDFERRHGHAPKPAPGAPGAKIRYRVMSDVAENWIPMVPVHVEGDNREVKLQRAAMLRILDGDVAGGVPVDPLPVRPRTSLLRAGLDGPELPTAYFVHEEEIPRAGIRVTRAFQRARWRDGRPWVWFGARKQTGRGEGSSGLAFDRIVDLPSSGS